MRKRNARPTAPTVIIQQPNYGYRPGVELVERAYPANPQEMLLQLAQMITQQQNQAAQEPAVQTFDVKEAAEYLRISSWSVYDMIRTKSIPFFKVKSRYFFRRHELDKWISENTNDCSGR